MTDNVTFLDKIEATFAELKAGLIHEFGDHMSIHNAVQDAKTKVLDHSVEHLIESPTLDKEQGDSLVSLINNDPTAPVVDEANVPAEVKAVDPVAGV